MKNHFSTFIFTALLSAAPLAAQENQPPASLPSRPTLPLATARTGAPAEFASDLAVVHDAQEQALEQARQLLAQGENLRDRDALETAVKQMERAQAALDEAKKSPDKLPAALAAEQTAYQALLKIAPREYNMTRSRNRGQGGSQNQSQQRQLDQLEMQREENRYETERQAAAPPSEQQREQLQTADRLKELAQRQQDMNERLRELQTALQAAHTDQEREDVQRQLKRLRDEERQMLASADELRQRLEQSPNASSQAETRQQLDQARSDMERATQDMKRESPSQALAAGTRAQERMQNLREDLRRQTSGQFTEQMRELRNQARELARQQEEIARGLESLNNGEHQSLDNSAERQQIVQQMNRQQSALTNLLSGMRHVTEQAETTEPLLSQKLYDTLRRADQAHTDNLLEMGTQLVGRGFLPQASQAERSARTNINELRQSVERAAESVLGSEADALRFAQKELDDLARQIEREIGDARTNAAGLGAGAGNENQAGSNRDAGVESAAAGESAAGHQGTNSMAGANGRSSEGESQLAGNSSERQPGGEANSPGGTETGNGGNRPDAGQPQLADNNSSREPRDSPGREGAGQRQGARNGGGLAGGDRLRQLAEQLGTEGGRGGPGGPITGNDYVNWSDRLRDVERVLDPQDLRNQLTTVRERVATFRAEFRERGRKPEGEVLRNQILAPMTQVRVWLQQELARQSNANSLVPLDRDPVPDNYSELVRKYYEKLGSAQ